MSSSVRWWSAACFWDVISGGGGNPQGARWEHANSHRLAATLTKIKPGSESDHKNLPHAQLLSWFFQPISYLLLLCPSALARQSFTVVLKCISTGLPKCLNIHWGSYFCSGNVCKQGRFYNTSFAFLNIKHHKLMLQKIILAMSVISLVSFISISSIFILIHLKSLSAFRGQTLISFFAIILHINKSPSSLNSLNSLKHQQKSSHKCVCVHVWLVGACSRRCVFEHLCVNVTFSVAWAISAHVEDFFFLTLSISLKVHLWGKQVMRKRKGEVAFDMTKARKWIWIERQTDRCQGDPSGPLRLSWLLCCRLPSSKNHRDGKKRRMSDEGKWLERQSD